MRPIFSMAVVVSLVLLAGCRKKSASDIAEEAAEADARRACQTHTVVLTPWAIESTLVEENEYRHLVKSISDEIGLGLQDRLGKLNKFARVVPGTECPSGVRIENRVVSLIHKKRRYHYKIAGRAVECGTERLLHTWEMLEEQKDVTEIAPRIAAEISEEIEDKVRCAMGNNDVPPPPPPPTPEA